MKTSTVFVGFIAVAVVFGATPTRAFSPDLLKSVVVVLPQWPDRRPPSPAQGRLEEPEGTGIAVLPGGYVATNAHVLGRAGTIRVRYADGRMAPAEIIGTDPLTDIALIRAPDDLPVPSFGPLPTVGSRVCAVGNPFGLGLSVSCGVVSAVHRSGTGFNPIEDFIQTDAAVNPGGSGGPLADAQGRVVGMVSAIFTKRNDADIGVNFAASMDLVMRVAEDLREYGKVKRGKSGLRVVDLTADQRRTIAGAEISRVAGAAQKAGLKVGDVITAIDGRPIRKSSDVAAALYLHRIGGVARVTVARQGRPERQATVRLTLAP